MSAFIEADHFRGKHVFIAGGTSGINQGIGHGFAALGANIATCSRSAEKVEAAVAGFKGEGVQSVGIAADVRDYDQVAGALKTAAEALGPIDVLISGAAGNFVTPALGMSANAFRTVVEIDLQGTFNVFRAGHEHLATGPGGGASVIAISAPQAVNPYALQSHVCAAKAGIDMLVQCLAIEWGQEGIRVNSVIPGPIEDTEGMARLAPTDADKEKVIQGTPMRRYGRKQEIADACIFLSSPRAGYITGVNLPVDGGAVLMGAGRMQAAMESAYEQAMTAHRTA